MNGTAASSAISLKLRPVLDLTAAEPLKFELLALRGQPVSIDASEVERIGGLCLQVLMSAHKTWSQEDVPFSVGAASSNFEDGMSQLGAASFLSSLTRE